MVGMVICSNNFTPTSQHVGNMSMIQMHGNETTDVPSRFPVILYHRINLHLVSTRSTNEQIHQHRQHSNGNQDKKKCMCDTS